MKLIKRAAIPLVWALLPVAAKGAEITSGTLFLDAHGGSFDYGRYGISGPVPNYFSYVELQLRGPATNVAVIQLGAIFREPSCDGNSCVYDFGQFFHLEMNQFVPATFTLNGTTYTNVIPQAIFAVPAARRNADSAEVCPGTTIFACEANPLQSSASWANGPVSIGGTVLLIDAQTREVVAMRDFLLEGQARATYRFTDRRWASVYYDLTGPVAIPEAGSRALLVVGVGFLVLILLARGRAARRRVS